MLPNIALIAGCHSDETSTDAYINGDYNGAFTYYFVQTLRAPGDLWLPLTQLLPKVQAGLSEAGYKQIPQLSGSPAEVAHAFLQS